MEVVEFQQAQLINSDLDMYYAKTDTPALCRTSSLVEELGQIEYVFSDKTGTLTCNEMEFRFCSIGGVVYADVVEESRRGEGNDGKDGWKSFAEMKALLGPGENPFGDFSPATETNPQGEREVINEFLTLLAVCHTVIPENRDGKMHYQASSPDEAALVAGAEIFGYQFSVNAEAEVGIREHSGWFAGVPDSEHLRVQLDTEAHVDGRAVPRWQDQALLQRRGHRHS